MLLTHPDVSDAAVLGLDDDTWGEVVAAVVVSSSPEDLTLQALQDFCGGSLPPYSVPRRLKLMEELPRNQVCLVGCFRCHKSPFFHSSF